MTALEIILVMLIIINAIIFNLQIKNIWDFLNNQIELDKSFVQSIKKFNDFVDFLGEEVRSTIVRNDNESISR